MDQESPNSNLLKPNNELPDKSYSERLGESDSTRHSGKYHLRDYTNLPLEIFVLTLTILPFLLLAYFYSALPDRVPLFLKLNGEVAVWGEKSVMSVFRVPLLAVVTQVVCFLMKYETVQAAASLTFDHASQRYLSLNTRMWDWLRWTVAFKMSAESLHTVFLSLPSLNYLSQPAFLVTTIAVAIGVVGALFRLYRVLVTARKMKKQPATANERKPSKKYGFSFRNVRTWILIACAIAYPLLVLLPG